LDREIEGRVEKWGSWGVGYGLLEIDECFREILASLQQTFSKLATDL
jgi:hypothetical protein